MQKNVLIRCHRSLLCPVSRFVPHGSSSVMPCLMPACFAEGHSFYRAITVSQEGRHFCNELCFCFYAHFTLCFKLALSCDETKIHHKSNLIIVKLSGAEIHII